MMTNSYLLYSTGINKAAKFLTRLGGDRKPRAALDRAIEIGMIDRPGEYLIVESGAWSTDPPHIWRYTVKARTSLYSDGYSDGS